MGSFKPASSGQPEQLLNQFNSFMQKLADEREKKMLEFSARLNEQRRNRQAVQEQAAFNLARISPAAAFTLASSNLVGTSLALKQHYLEEAGKYQQAYASFIRAKTGGSLGGGRVMVFRTTDGEEEKRNPIDPRAIPPFVYQAMPLNRAVQAAVLDFGLLIFFNVVFFAGAFVSFLRYDLR